MYRVNIFSFDEHVVLNDMRFQKCLEQLNAVTHLCLLKNTVSEPIPLSDINVLMYSALFPIDLAVSQSRLLSELQPSVPIFCIIPEQEPLNEKLFDCIDDYAFWPCGEIELKTRMLRMIQPALPPFSADEDLLSEFAAMNLIGQSTRFIRNVQLIKRMASCHAAVLIQGETGTGKENAARAIHYLSDRREQGFVPVNCAAIPDELLESELFGYEKGAFTDAKQAQTGLVAFANRGTLFLDEIDSLTPKAQAALLRFLQTQEYRPLGAKQTLHADVRVLAATNADLHQLVASKAFREDLYFRLNVLNIVMPPLRERLEDIAAISASMLNRFANEYSRPVKRLDRIGLNYLMNQHWAGNIRELENCLLRAFLLSTGSTLQFTDPNGDPLSDEQAIDYDGLGAGDVVELSLAHSPVSFQQAKAWAVTRFEENYLQQLMQLTQGNISAAARLAGKERRALGRLLQKYAIDKSQFQTHTIR